MHFSYAFIIVSDFSDLVDKHCHKCLDFIDLYDISVVFILQKVAKCGGI